MGALLLGIECSSIDDAGDFGTESPAFRQHEVDAVELHDVGRLRTTKAVDALGRVSHEENVRPELLLPLNPRDLTTVQVLTLIH